MNDKQQNVMAQQVATRMSARTMLRDRIDKARQQIEQLEALDKALPLELPPAADEALWELLIRSRF